MPKADTSFASFHKRTGATLAFISKCVPFVLAALAFVGWIFLSDSTISNDYPIVLFLTHIHAFYESLGHLPHWYSFLEGGFPWVSPHQTFHLPAWLVVHFPGFLDGNAAIAFGLKYVFLFSFGHAFTYRFMRKFAPTLTRPAAFVLSLAILYGLRSLDCLRYMTFLDAFVYMHCLALLFVEFLEFPSVVGFSGLVLFSQLLFTSTYQTVAAFGALEILLLSGWLASSWKENPDHSWKVFFQRLGITATAAIAGLGLSAPNLLPFMEWLSQNHARGTHPTIEWAESIPMEWVHSPLAIFRPLFINLVTPWFADVTTAFGGTTLLSLLILSVPIYLGLTFRRNWILLGSIGFLYLYGLGSRTPIFPFFFHFVPGFSHFRVPGRILVLLPTLLTFGTVELARGLAMPKTIARRRLAISIACLTHALLSATGFFLIRFRDYPSSIWDLVRSHSDYFWPPFRLNPAAWNPGMINVWILSELAIISAIYGLSIGKMSSRKLQAPLLTLVIVFTSLQAGYLFRFGTFTILNANLSVPTSRDLVRADHLPLQHAWPIYSVNYPTSEALQSTIDFTELTDGSSSCFFRFANEADQTFKGRIELPWYLTAQTICSSHWKKLTREEKESTCQRPLGVIVDDRFSPCNTPGLPTQTREAYRELVTLNQTTSLQLLTPNLIELDVNPIKPVILSTSIPFHPNWTATVNGKKTSILKANGGLIGIELRKGHQKIVLAYQSEAIWNGYLISLACALALFFLGVEINLIKPKKMHRQPMKRIPIYVTLTALIVWTVASSFKEDYRDWESLRIPLNHSFSARLSAQVEIWSKMAASLPPHQK